MQSDWKFVHGRYFWRVKYTQKDVVEFSTFSIISDLPLRPAIYMSMCHPLVIPTWYSLLGFTWNSIPGEARCGVFLRNRVTYRDHLPLDIFGGWHLSIGPSRNPLWYCKGCDSIRLRSLSASSCVYLFELFIYLLPRVLQSLLLNYISL